MNKIIITLALILTVTISFADGRDKATEVRPSSELLNDDRSFEVGNLKACDVEADDEDAIDILEELPTEKSSDLIPMTEDVEESTVEVFNFDQESNSSSNLLTEDLEDCTMAPFTK